MNGLMKFIIGCLSFLGMLISTTDVPTNNGLLFFFIFIAVILSLFSNSTWADLLFGEEPYYDNYDKKPHHKGVYNTSSSFVRQNTFDNDEVMKVAEKQLKKDKQTCIEIIK